MQLKDTYKLSTSGILSCTLNDHGIAVMCNVQKDVVIYDYKDKFTEFKIQRTPDEQYYIYQKGKYEPICSDSTFESVCTKEIVQLIPTDDVDILLEDLGAVSTFESILMSELS